MVDRFQPPQGVADGAAARALSDVSRVLDGPRLAFRPETATALSVAPGEIRRLSPRSGGQTVVLPAAAASNAGAAIALFVSGLGVLTVMPVSGTINGASSLAFAAGTFSLEIVSDGERWLTPGLADGGITTVKIATNAVTNAKLAQMAQATVKGRTLAGGTGDPVDLTAAQVMDLLEPEAATWTGNWNLSNRIRWSNAFEQTLTGNTDNLAIGAVNVVRLVGNNFTLSGMVPDADDQLVWLQNADAADTLTLAHDATSTAANRFYCPANISYIMPARSAVWARYDGASARWFIGSGSVA